MKKSEYIDKLIDVADSMCYADYCRLLTVLYWNFIV